MTQLNNKVKFTFIVMLSALFFITSCNKKLEQPVFPAESGSTLGDAIASTSTYSIFNAALVRTGLNVAIKDSASNFTIFVPDDNAMTASGLSLATVNAMPLGTLTSIVQYHIISGSRVSSSLFSGVFPNLRIPTTLALDPTNPFVRMSLFPSKLTSIAYANATPITVADQAFNNGVIHNVATILQPPSATMKTMIAAEASLSYFRAAITRADSGSTGLGKLDSLLNYGVTNMTVVAPNDAAFQTLIYGLAYQKYLSTRPMPYTATDSAIANATGNGAVAAGPAFLSTNNVSTLQIKGIIAYHFFATNSTGSYTPNIRVFSVNIPAVPAYIKTLVSGSFPTHPGILANAVFTGPVTSSISFRGLGTFPSGGAPYSGTPSNVVTKDKHGVNGVYHIIDRVLLPQ